MTEDQQLKLQAFLDGELPETDSREIAALLARDADAAALLGELTNTRTALKSFETPGPAGVSPASGTASLSPSLKLPESREFYWSKIKREIERSTPAAAPAPTASLFTRFRRILMPLGAVAMLALVGIIGIHVFSGGQRPIAVNSMLADAGAFTYRDESQGMTVVWLSYPAENKFAQKTSGDTLSPK
jgi:anti-sigma factor RsiW